MYGRETVKEDSRELFVFEKAIEEMRKGEILAPEVVNERGMQVLYSGLRSIPIPCAHAFVFSCL